MTGLGATVVSASSSLKGRLQKPSLAKRPIPLKGNTESDGGVPTMPRRLSGLKTDLLRDLVAGPVIGSSTLATASGVVCAAGAGVCCESLGVSLRISNWTETRGPSPRKPSTAACSPLQQQNCIICSLLQATGMYAAISNWLCHGAYEL